jgi:hypothetical protein
MPLTLKQNKIRRFIFQNSNGIQYDVRIDHDGNGSAYKLTGTSSKGDRTKNSITKVTFTVDAGDLATARVCHISRLCFDQFYNTNQTLNTVLNAAS